MGIMRVSGLFIVILVLLSTYSVVFAADIPVTSNLDNGPGTLREALLYAKTLSVAKRIVFDLGSTEAERSISLLTSLPDLSSNLIIDGTTQTGSKFGISDATVKIILPPGNTMPVCLQGDRLNNIAIYGLFIDKPVLLTADKDGSNGISTGILLRSCKEITIGATGQGNFISNVNNAIVVKYDYFGGANDFDDPALLCENVKISANIIGLSQNGTTNCELGSSDIRCLRVKNLTIGGTVAGEGNIVIGQIIYGEDQDNFRLSTEKISIKGNQVGLSFAGNNALLANFTSRSITAINVNALHLTDCEVTENSMAGIQKGIVISVNCFFKIKGNKIGTDVSGTKTIGLGHDAMLINNCPKGGIIGGAASADKNLVQGAFQNPYPGYEEFGLIQNNNSPSLELLGNAFKCNKNKYTYAIKPAITVTAAIKNRTAAYIEGTATANSRIDLYYSISPECTSCEPEVLFATLTADNTGNWRYTGGFQNYNVIASATLLGQTSEFTSIRADFTQSDVKIKMVCDGQKGSITGLLYKNASDYKWYNDRGERVGFTNDVSNLDPGLYYLEVSDGFCTTRSEIYQITDISIQTQLTPVVQSATCAGREGSITGITSSGTLFVWKNSNGLVVASGSTPNLTGVAAGNYTLTVSNDGGCSKTYPAINIPVLSNPIVSVNNQLVSPATCDNADGSIKGITISGSGPYTFSWKNQLGVEVQRGSDPDLLNVAAGRYILEITGGSICGSAFTSEIEIMRSGSIVLDETRVLTVRACNGTNGSITGMVVSGASTYTWLDESGHTVFTSTNTPNLMNASPGRYKLQARSSICVKESQFYTILSPIVLDVSAVVIVPDQCSGGKGGLSNISVSGGLAPYTYIWTDSNGKKAGDQANLTGVKPGQYSLKIGDVYGEVCNHPGYDFTVPDQIVLLDPPLVPDVSVCAPGEAVIRVQNPLKGTYSLFDDPAASTPIAFNSSGTFTVQAGADAEYYIGYTSGTCSSVPVAVKVSVSDNEFRVLGSFTPNGDGINDTWSIVHIENYPRAYIRLYNRYGQQVFKSIGYTSPFDGKKNGTELPAGTYYYVIDLRSGCKTLSGNLSIIR